MSAIPGLFSITDYGASTAANDNSTAINNASAAAAAAGGVVWFPNGTWKCTQPVVYYQSTRWLGAGTSATILRLVNDLYTSGNGPAHFIVPNVTGAGGFTQGDDFSIEHMTIQGPGQHGVGSNFTRTSGVQLNPRARTIRCYVSGFFAGGEIFGDHQIIQDSKFANNYYGLEFPDGMQTWGNQSFNNVNVAGNNLAGIHIGGSGTIDGCTFTQVHSGFGPCGILKTNSQNGFDASLRPTYGGAASTRGAVTGSDFIDFFFEQIGNCPFLDISTGGHGSFVYSQMRTVGHSWAPFATYGTANNPLNSAEYQAQWAWDVSSDCRGSMIDGGEGPFIAGSVGTYKFPSGGLTIRQPATIGISNSYAGSGGNYPTPKDGSLTVEWYGGMREGCGRAYTLYASGAINAGDLVELSGSGRVQRAAGHAPIFGVASTPSTGAGQPVLVQTDGFININCVGSSQLLHGTVLVTASSTPYLADSAAHNPTGWPVGVMTWDGANPTTVASSVALRPALVAA